MSNFDSIKDGFPGFYELAVNAESCGFLCAFDFRNVNAGSAECYSAPLEFPAKDTLLDAERLSALPEKDFPRDSWRPRGEK